ncbi:RNA 2',3'-cyclic phosphodiesterase [Candidatus Dependentiae bacterium]
MEKKVNRRLFVAVEIPQHIKEELETICVHFTKRELFTGTCTSSENLHVTLKFLDSVSEDTIDKITESLKNIHANACKATLSGLGVLPTRRITKILFADLDCFCLSILAKQIEQELSWLLQPEDRDFKNHITIARVKNIEDKELFLHAVDKFQVQALSFDVTAFVLKESVLTPDGPMYSTIASYNLY